MREFAALARLVSANRAAAERIFAELSARPPAEWLPVLVSSEASHTPQMLEHLARAAGELVDDQPQRALEILAVAEGLVPHVSADHFSHREACFEMAVQRGAALVPLERYFDALAAFREARALLSHEPDRAFHRAALLVERARLYLKTRRRIRRAVFLLTTAAVVFHDFGAHSARGRALRFLREAGIKSDVQPIGSTRPPCRGSKVLAANR